MPIRTAVIAAVAAIWLPACKEDPGTAAGETAPDRAPAACPADPSGGQAPYPKSRFINDLRFDFDSLIELAPGSDNWAITWAANGSQYATWGDGGGFGGSDGDGRVSMGVARIDGSLEEFTTQNIWGGKNALAEATHTGKSYGIVAVDDTLFLWRTGEQSEDSAFDLQDLLVSRDGGRTFQRTGVAFTPDQFPSSRGFFAPTFLQFGPGYSAAPDEYIYVFAPEIKSDEWDVQVPGEIALMRVPQAQMDDQAAYEYFCGLDSRGLPHWTGTLSERSPVFSDPANGVMHTSVTYNAGLGRYILMTQQRTRREGGYIGIYESEAPWGPWMQVLFENAWELGLQRGGGSIFWNFSNKWTSEDGRRSALVFTGTSQDNFGVLTVEFELAGDNL